MGRRRELQRLLEANEEWKYKEAGGGVGCKTGWTDKSYHHLELDVFFYTTAAAHFKLTPIPTNDCQDDIEHSSNPETMQPLLQVINRDV